MLASLLHDLRELLDQRSVYYMNLMNLAAVFASQTLGVRPRVRKAKVDRRRFTRTLSSCSNSRKTSIYYSGPGSSQRQCQEQTLRRTCRPFPTLQSTGRKLRMNIRQFSSYALDRLNILFDPGHHLAKSLSTLELR